MRHGGAVRRDEFLLALPDIDGRANATLIAQRVVDCFEEPFLVEGRMLHVTASLGIANYPGQATELETLVRFADLAPHEAKAAGRNCCALSNDE